MSRKMRENLVGFSFIGIWIIGFLIFMVYPLVNSLIYSFSDVKIMGTGIKVTFQGVKNYQNIFQIEQGFEFISSLMTFLKELVLQVPIIIVFSVIIALLLNQPLKGLGIFRSIFFLPVIISSGPVINELISQGAGGTNLINNYGFIQIINSTLSDTFAEPVVKIFSQIIIIFWFSGVQILIILAGLQKIDKQVYESAQIDGAGPWEMFWKITLPSLRQLILINAVYTIILIATFSENDVILKIKANMFNIKTGYGMACAMAWFYFVVLIIIIGLTALVLIPKNKKVVKRKW